MDSSVRRGVRVRMEECVTMLLESAPVLQGGWVQCVVSHVQREDSGRTAPRNVSVTTMAFVCRPLDSVSAALDTQGNGVRTSVQLELMVLAVQRHVAVRTMPSATTSTACVCVSQDSQGRRAMSDCVLKDVTASAVTESVRATNRTLAAATRCRGSAHVSVVGRASTATRRAPQDFMASPASRCASARTAPTATV